MFPQSHSMKMYLPLSLLICLSVIQLSMGEQPADEIIVPKKVVILGGWNVMNPHSRDVQEAAEHAVALFNADSKSKKMFKLFSIIAVKSKVTNVIHYKIKAVLGRTQCLKSENYNLENCNFETRHVQCQCEVTFDPRDNKHELLRQKCNKIVEKF